MAQALEYSKRYYAKMQETFKGLWGKILPDTALENNALVFYEFGGYAVGNNYGVDKFWFLASAIAADTLKPNAENFWVQNDCYWRLYPDFMRRFEDLPKYSTYSAFQLALDNGRIVRRNLR